MRQKKKLRIDDVTLKLHPHQKMLLAARSEIIVQAITDKNSFEIEKSVKTRNIHRYLFSETRRICIPGEHN